MDVWEESSKKARHDPSFAHTNYVKNADVRIKHTQSFFK